MLNIDYQFSDTDLDWSAAQRAYVEGRHGQSNQRVGSG